MVFYLAMFSFQRTAAKSSFFRCNDILVPYVCRKCYFITDEKIHTFQHDCKKRQIDDSIVKRCPKCNLQSFSNLWITLHKIKECYNKYVLLQIRYRLTSKKFKCDQCHYQSFYRQHLNKHFKNVHIPDNLSTWYHCEHCLYKTKHDDYLKRHIKQIHSEGGKRFKCDQCNHATHTSTLLKNHKLNHHVSENARKWYSCTNCSMKFKSRPGLKYHKVNKHSTVDKRFKCEQCSFSTNFHSSMKYHKTSKHGINENRRMFQCLECKYKTCSESHLRRHYSTRHCPDHLAKWSHCTICKFKSKHPSSLQTHIRFKHSKETKKFECDECGFKTHVNRYLLNHKINKHTPDELITWYYCQKCSYRTKHNNSLTHHLKIKH